MNEEVRRTAHAITQGAYELVKEGWTQGTWARDAADEPVSQHHPNAASFCISGAINRSVWDYFADGVNNSPALEAVRFESVRLIFETLAPDFGLAEWNDDPNTSYEKVLDLFKRGLTKLASVSA